MSPFEHGEVFVLDDGGEVFSQLIVLIIIVIILLTSTLKRCIHGVLIVVNMLCLKG